jgi:hypothetical protein
MRSLKSQAAPIFFLSALAALANCIPNRDVCYWPIPLKKSVFEQDGRNSQREPTAS